MSVFGGIRVVNFATGIASSMTSMILSDYGADVVLAEPPGGDPLRGTPAWKMWSRGTRSVVIDLADPSHRELAEKLAFSADVVIETWRSGEGTAAGLDYASVRAINPRVVYCTLSAMGEHGALAGLPPHDGLVEARGGSFLDLGNSSGKPGTPVYRMRPSPSFASAMVLVQGISAALSERESSGHGQRLSTSLYQSFLVCSADMALRRQFIQPAAATSTFAEPPFMPYLVCRTKDGQWMQVANNTGRLFRQWMTALDLDYIWDDDRFKGAPFQYPDRESKRALAFLIHERMALKTYDEWEEIFLKEGLAGERFISTQEALDHPQVVHNQAAIDVADPEVGTTRQFGFLVEMSESPGSVLRGAPVLDEHRQELLAATPEPTSTALPPAPAGTGGPLSGLLVLDFSAYIAGPLAASVISDMGARVIKIEPPEGDGLRSLGAGTGSTFQGKEILAINLKTEEGQQALGRLLTKADAVLHNMRPDAAMRVGIDYAKVKSLNPEVVYVYAGSYGSTGPGAGRPAFHPIMGALSGGVVRQMGEGNIPLPYDQLSPEETFDAAVHWYAVNEAIPDYAGGLGAATGMAMGLLHKARTGKGQYIETTMFASNLFLCSEDAIRYEGKPEFVPLDRSLRGTGPLNRLYPCRQGWLFLSCQSDEEWRRLAAALGRPGWLADARFHDAESRGRFSDQLIAEVWEALSTKSAGEWESSLLEAGLAGVQADEMDGAEFLFSHPQSVENQTTVEASFPGGATFRRTNPPVRFDRTPASVYGVHAFAEDSRAILTELGFDDETISAWAEKGVVVLAD